MADQRDCFLGDVLDKSDFTRAAKILDAVGVPVWIETAARLPDSGIPVLIFVQNVEANHYRTLRAHYAARHYLEWSFDSGNEDNMDYDYDEASGITYCAEGWYETTESDGAHWWIDDDVTHWMPLPEPPNTKVIRDEHE